MNIERSYVIVILMVVLSVSVWRNLLLPFPSGFVTRVSQTVWNPKYHPHSKTYFRGYSYFTTNSKRPMRNLDTTPTKAIGVPHCTPQEQVHIMHTPAFAFAVILRPANGLSSVNSPPNTHSSWSLQPLILHTCPSNARISLSSIQIHN